MYILENNFNIFTGLYYSELYFFLKYYKFDFQNVLKDIVILQKQIHGNSTKDYMNMQINEYFEFLQALSIANKEEKDKAK